jgi:hypothetical protein
VFTYSMPITVPPGRAGMQPALAVTYTSSEAEGALGVGFALSGLSAIARCPRNLAQDGEVRAVEMTVEDRLCLDGQRLVLESGTYGAPGATYGTEEDELLRIDALGTEEALTFRVRMPDGRERHYGTSADGLILALNRNREFVRETWLLARELDPRGNTVDYTYRARDVHARRARPRAVRARSGRRAACSLPARRGPRHPRGRPNRADRLHGSDRRRTRRGGHSIRSLRVRRRAVPAGRQLLAGVAGFAVGGGIGYGTAALASAGLSNPFTAPFVVVVGIGFGSTPSCTTTRSRRRSSGPSEPSRREKPHQRPTSTRCRTSG